MDEPNPRLNIINEQPNIPERLVLEEDTLLNLINEKCQQRLPFAPKSWQVDVTIKILKKQNIILLSRTGSGKSLCFVLPGLITGKPTLILSPLNVLEEDQAAAFASWGIRAIGLNANNCTQDMLKKIGRGGFEVVITSPELVLESKKWRVLVSSPRFNSLWGLVVVDEAHCMLQWGLPRGKKKAFRPAWGKIGEIRALIHKDIPWLAAMATLAVEDIGTMRHLLNASSNLHVINLGNDRPDIFMEYREMKYDMKGMRDLLGVILARRGEPLPITMVFFDNRELTHQAHEKIQAALRGCDKNKVAVYHAMRSANAKRAVMKKFRAGEVRILLCTEAAGMGCDIPFIEKVVQWRVPLTLSIWLQRAGRAARSPTIKGHAILFGRAKFKEEIERFWATNGAITLPSGDVSGQKKKKMLEFPVLRANSRTHNGPFQTRRSGLFLYFISHGHFSYILRSRYSSTSVVPTTEFILFIQTLYFLEKKPKRAKGKREEEQEVGIEEELKCDEGMANWVMGGCCRRIIQAKYFGNPVIHEPVVPSLCCDFCRDSIMSRPLTPVPDTYNDNPDFPASHHSQQSVVLEPDLNGKRKKGETWRNEEDQKRVMKKIIEWRDDMWKKEYPNTYLPVDIIIDDEMIQRIAKFVRLCQPDELRREWGGFERFGGKVLLLVERVDDEIARENLVAQEEKKAAAAAAKAQANQLKELTNASVPRRPPACRTPVFNLPGTGVFQVQLQTPDTLSANSSMTSVFSTTTWETDEALPSLAPHRNLPDTAFTIPATFMPWNSSAPSTSGVTRQANLENIIQGSQHAQRPRPRPRPIKKAKVQHMELDDN